MTGDAIAGRVVLRRVKYSHAERHLQQRGVGLEVPGNVGILVFMQYSTLYATLLRAVERAERRELAIDGYHHAAVLVPVISSGDTAELLFTRRTEAVESHKGQVSFPGGVVEEDDRSIVHTALREACEELGLCEGAVQPLGLLDDIATPSGFIITPVVGIAERRPALRPNLEEVAEAFYVPLGFFAGSETGRKSEREFLGERHEVWYYDTGTHLIWGATAAIVRGLLKGMGLL